MLSCGGAVLVEVGCEEGQLFLWFFRGSSGFSSVCWNIEAVYCSAPPPVLGPVLHLCLIP